MALQVDWSNNRFGVPAPESYTRVVSAEARRQVMYNTPDNPADLPPIATTHVVQFRTETFINKAALEAGQNPIEEHGYMFYWKDEPVNILKMCYSYLKTEVDVFKNAVDV